MALEIGGGITLGGGISLTVESGGGGGSSTEITGTATILNAFGPYYGAAYPDSPPSGQLTSTANCMSGIQKGPSNFVLFFNIGTFGPFTINTSGINGNPNISFTFNGVTATPDSGPANPPPYISWTFNGDPFNTLSIVGQTLPFTVTLL